MKAKDLAEYLLRYPDFEVSGIHGDSSKCDVEHPYPEYYFFAVSEIADVGHSDKMIVLDLD